MFKLEIETSNDAFGETDADRTREVARILACVVDYLSTADLMPDAVMRAGDSHKVRDANGNTVGSYGIAEPDPVRDAAPEMLFALKELLFCAVHGNGLEAHYKAQDRARTVIAKAEGRSNG